MKPLSKRRPIFTALLSLFVAAASAWPFSAKAEDAPAPPPTTTQPVSAEEVRYRTYVGLADVLLDEPSNDDLFRMAQARRRGGDYAGAAVLGLTALRGKPDDPLVEYELACNFALWGQAKLATQYLTLAADDGYWGYRIANEDTDLAAIKDAPEFDAALVKIKTSFDAQAAKNPPGRTVALPKGEAPAGGWPVVVCLHGWASSRHDFDDLAEFVSTLGYVGVTLDGTEVMGPGAYMWTRDNAGPTHAQIQAALKKLPGKVDAKRVYLQGFSQGAMHAARLLADHPQAYRGAICNSPGSLQLAPASLKSAGATGPIFLSVGSDDLEPCKAAVPKIEALWKSAKRPVRVVRFEGGHQLPPDAQKWVRETLAFLEARK